MEGERARSSVLSGSFTRTVELGSVFGKLIPAGTKVSFEGGLGSGKTCFIKGICSGLGIGEEILSPSFILAEEYRGVLPVVHFDLFRLEELREVYQAGLFDADDGNNIILVEWGDRLPPDSFGFDMVVLIEIESANNRLISIEAPENFIDSFEEAADAE